MPALEGPSPRREGEDPGLGAHRLHLRKQHLDARARPVAREAAARHVGGAADRVDEARMAGEEIADGGARDVGLRIGERAVGRREVGGGGDRGAGLQVEAGGVLGVDRRRRQRRLHHLRRLDAHRPGLGGDGVVEDQERAERHRLGEDRESEQPDHRPARSDRHRRGSDRRHTGAADPDPTDRAPRERR
jgi:hypothetical protein